MNMNASRVRCAQCRTCCAVWAIRTRRAIDCMYDVMMWGCVTSLGRGKKTHTSNNIGDIKTGGIVCAFDTNVIMIFPHWRKCLH